MLEETLEEVKLGEVHWMGQIKRISGRTDSGLSSFSSWDSNWRERASAAVFLEPGL
jgi:hypothetical protein